MVAMLVSTFFLEDTTIPGAICVKFHPQVGCPPKKRSAPVFLPHYCASHSQERHRARVPRHHSFSYRDKRMITVVLAMLAD